MALKNLCDVGKLAASCHVVLIVLKRLLQKYVTLRPEQHAGEWEKIQLLKYF